MVLEAYYRGVKGTLLFGDTGLTSKDARRVVERLRKHTGFPLMVAKYTGEKSPRMIIEESFPMIPLVLEDIKKQGHYRKNRFDCCRILKHKPMDSAVGCFEKDDLVQVLGIKGADGSFARRWRLSELRNRGTYSRLKADGFLFYYPLRDCSDADISQVLYDFGFGKIKSSGCVLCPVFCIFDGMRKKDPGSWFRSVSLARKLKIPFYFADQTLIRDYCTGVR